ncbi:uncharacterized protein LOC110754590 [Prunus avium]|uniref:Uncharacterized protein LOC110754590 n=1 Tax=Prunus avium TaxID=42229 RepID=A0A6P5SC01_PRUAV|nr:uncharacterized protein LOC110754590 [Prunus avium]
MEFGVHGNEPVSPTGQCLNSSVLSMSILGVLEFEIPINESKILSFLQDVFLPISPRFSSIMVDINGEKQWKRVEVKLRDHVQMVSETFASVFDTVKDFSWNSLLQDDLTPIRSGIYGVEFLPMTISSMTFSLDEIKLIKTKLNTVINDVIAGALFFATRLYMQEKSQKSSTASCTALVLVNTRITHGDYKPIKEMIKPDSEMPWGNQMAFMPVTMPKLTQFSNPLDFVFKAQKLIKRRRSSFAVYVNKKMLEIVKKIRGYEGASRYMHSRLKNSSLMISNMIGPAEQMALADHPVRGVYFMVLGIPQDLIVTVVSYMGKVRIAFGTQKGLIDPEKFKACMENAFKMILEATDNIPTQTY